MTRRSKARSEAPEWVKDRTLPADTPRGLREAVLADIVEATGADAAAYHSVGLVDGEFYFRDVHVHRDQPQLAPLRACVGRPLAEVADESAEWTSSVNALRLVIPEEHPDRREYRRLWEPMGCAALLSMHAVVDRTMVGWIGALQLSGSAPSFADGLLVDLRSRVDAYVHCLDIAHRLEVAASQVRGLLFFEPDGQLAFACEAGRRWLASRGLTSRLIEGVRSGAPNEVFSSDGAIVRLTPMKGRAGDLYCAELVPVDVWRVPDFVELSPQQRQVAELAALGASAREVGRMLEISQWTVRSHLKQIYQRLGISSRLELAERMRSLAVPLLG